MNPCLLNFLLYFCFALSAYGQGETLLWFHLLDKEAGISNTHIHAIFHDSEGFIWIASESGLDRYDGHNIEHYAPASNDSTALIDNRVYGRFFEDARKDIWFCTDGGIQCYQRQFDHFAAYRVNDRGLQVKSGYEALFLERDSLLWIRAGGNYFYHFNIHTNVFTGPLMATSMDIGVYPGVAENGSLRYLFAVDGSKSPGLELFVVDASRKLQKQKRKFDGSRSGEPSLNIHNVLYENDSTVWLSADSCLYKWNINTGTLRKYSNGLVNAIEIATLDSAHLMVLENEGGLFRFEKKSGSFEKINGKLLNNMNLDIEGLLEQPYVNGFGEIWFVYKDAGLLFACPEKIKFNSIPKFPSSTGLSNYNYRTILQGNDNKIWCSTFFDGIFLLDKEGELLRHYIPGHQPYGSINSKQINHMILDEGMGLWIATVKGISRYQPETDKFIPIPAVDGSPVKDASYIYQLRNGDILVATLQEGIFRIINNDGKWALELVYAPTDRMNFYTTIYEDLLGSIYISHNFSEVVIFDYSNGQLHPLPLPPKNISGFINGFHEPPDNDSLWIATTAGLAKLDKTNLTSPHELLVIPDKPLNCEFQSLVLGCDQQLWMGTSNGIVKYSPGNNLFTIYTLADGVQSRQFDGLAAMKHADGTIWFGGDNGITVVDPGMVGQLGVIPKIQLIGINVNDEPSLTIVDDLSKNTNVNTFRTIVQPYGENTLAFSFVAIDYSDPKSTQLKYKLDGVDDHWVLLTKGEPGFARYPNLPPNNYTFQIQAANSDGVWSGAIKELKIKITPPWYQTWWARCLFGFVLVASIYISYRYRIAQIRKAEEYKRKEAEYKQLVAETETAVLRLQMNPHFIFNSMNSISSYILHRDIATANDYLSRFAKLMRMILKFAEKPFLAISDEIDLLKQYLDTEAMRFEDNIDYEITVSANIDPDEIILPTMILQPFIENAIWHGLATKKGTKIIKVNFDVKDGQLLCSVEDNGIGRTAAAELKSPSKSHESKAINLTKRRLSLLEVMNSLPTDLQVIDLTDEAGMAIGTKVVITLPVL